LNKSTIQKAIKGGKITGTKDELGKWHRKTSVGKFKPQGKKDYCSYRSPTLAEQCVGSIMHRDSRCYPVAGRRAMKSLVVIRSIKIVGHKTSVSLEDDFWKVLREIAVARGMTLSDLVASIKSGRQIGNLSSAIRLFVLDFYRDQLPDHQAKHDGARAA